MTLPVDVAPSSEQPLKRFEQVLSKTTDTEVQCVPKTEILTSTQGLTPLCEILFHYSSKAITKCSYHIYIMWSISLPVSESGLRPSKCLKTNTDVPVEIPTPRLVSKMAR